MPSPPPCPLHPPTTAVPQPLPQHTPPSLISPEILWHELWKKKKKRKENNSEGVEGERERERDGPEQMFQPGLCALRLMVATLGGPRAEAGLLLSVKRRIAWLETRWRNRKAGHSCSGCVQLMNLQTCYLSAGYSMLICQELIRIWKLEHITPAPYSECNHTVYNNQLNRHEVEPRVWTRSLKTNTPSV